VFWDWGAYDRGYDDGKNFKLIKEQIIDEMKKPSIDSILSLKIDTILNKKINDDTAKKHN